MVVGEQPYKNRDMVGSDSGLGHLLINITRTAVTQALAIILSQIKNGKFIKKNINLFSR